MLIIGQRYHNPLAFVNGGSMNIGKKINNEIILADAIIQAMWIKGLITVKERDAIIKHCESTMNTGNC